MIFYDKYDINFQVKSVTKVGPNNLTIETNNGTIENVSCLLWAIGRVPNVEIGLDKVVSVPSEISCNGLVEFKSVYIERYVQNSITCIYLMMKHPASCKSVNWPPGST